MKEFCRKRQLRRSGKRWLAILLSVCLTGTMLPVTARAETGETQESGYEQEEENASVSENDKPDNESADEEDKPDNESEPEDDPAPSDDEEQTDPDEKDEVEDDTAIAITAWEWIDEEDIIDPKTGILALPFANEETPAFFDDVVALLPTQIQATVVNEEDIEAEAASETITLGDWSCEEYPKEGAYSESYTFAAALPEGYVLSEEAKALNVLVELGGAQMYENEQTTGAFTVTDGTLGTDYTYANGVLTIKTGMAITIKNTDPSTPTNDRIEVAEGVSANITLAGVNIDVSSSEYTAAFKIADDSTGNVTITLADDSVNTLKSGDNCAGLQKNGNEEDIGKLTIQGGTGKLIAVGGGNIGGAGIGGGGNGDGYNITISGGIVEATDISQGAGIGGGGGGSGSNITISGGSVTATGGFGGGAGIGGGGNGDGYNITISGGSVKAVAGSNANAIGGGAGKSAVTPTSNGETPVYLLTIANPDSKEVLIDGVSYTPVNHKSVDGNDTNLYAYLTGEPHLVKVGEKTCFYVFNSDSKTFSVAPLIIYPTNGGKLTYGTDYTYENNVLTIRYDTPITIANTDPNTATTDRIEVAEYPFANITLAGVNIDVSASENTAAFKIADNSGGNVTITLADGSVNTLKSGNNCAGLQKNGDEYTGTLIIQGGTNGTGNLTATGKGSGAGIGGGYSGTGSNITISGGTVTATGNWEGAGIGGGFKGAGLNIEITGGTVTATGSSYGAGIGGGYSGTGSNIEISGGTVTAISNGSGAGIGGGDRGSGSIITISGGTVTATGDGGAGIGGGANDSGSNIEITGGTVTATGGMYGAGIGGGQSGSGSDITISGGTVTATGGYGGAGIGGGSDGSGSGITMDGDAVFYTSSINGEHTFTKGVVYDGVMVSGDAGSYTLTGGVGTVYGNPNVSEFTKPASSILGTNLADADCITVTVPDVDYTGAEALPTATVTVNKTALSKTLVQGTDYTVSISDDDKTNAGAKNATIKAVTGSGNVGEITGNAFNVKPVALSVAKIEMSLSGIPETGYVYDSAAKMPEPKVTLKQADGSEYTLIKDTDYTVLYSNNTDAYELLLGDEGYKADKAPTVKITAKEGGNFTGSRSMNFKIYPADMPGFTIMPYSGSYDGINHYVVTITPVDGFSDYTVYYSTDNQETWTTTMPTITDAGTLDFYVKATKSNYKDWISDKQTAKVTPVALASSMISFNDTNHYYTGQEVKPEITVKDSNRTLVSGTDYTVSYTNNTSVSAESSKAKVTITAANGNYTGSASAEFKIEYANEKYMDYCTVSGTEGKDGWYSSDVTIQNKAEAEQNSMWGALKFSGTPAGTFADSYTVSAEGEKDVTIWFKQSKTGYIGSDATTVKIDKTAPGWTEDDCGISVKENWWKKLVNTISFGLFYKDATVDVKVCAKDNLSGIDAYYYYVDDSGSTAVKTKEELDALVNAFTKYPVDSSGSPLTGTKTLTSLSNEGNYVVYAYAVDMAGNRSAYICTSGMVVDRTAPTISDISTPSKNALTLTDQSATFTFTGSEAGTYFYMVRKSSEAKPGSIAEFAEEKEQPDEKGMSVWTAKEGVSYAAMKADGSNTVTVTGLDAYTEYTLYLAAVDQAGNSTTTTVYSKTFTTCKTMPTITTNPSISGTYGQKVEDMTLTDGVAKVGSIVITGTWELTDSNKANVPAVGTTNTYQVTFTPADTYGDIYDTVIVPVKPTVSKRAITVAADDKTKTYGQANPAFTYAITEGTLVSGDTETDLGITLTCVANEKSSVKAGGYAITGTSNSANYRITVIPGVLTITKATPVITATTAYVRTYGDSRFQLDAAGNSAEATLQYAVTESRKPDGSAAEKDAVVKVDKKGYVTIKGAGSAKITASLPETTNYNAASREITITVDKAAAAPNMPAETMDMPYHCEKVSDVPLPEDWVWQEADKSTELSIDRIVTADAVYDGADKGNYVKETVSVSLTRKDISGGLCIEEISDRTYNGKQIRPEVWVYYEKQLLTAGKDYTVSYKNNTNAAAADAVNAKGASIAPTVTVKGKGNYTGTVTKTFTIKPINLDNYKTDAQLQEILTIEPVCAKHTGKFIKATPTVKLNGKKLALSAKQYTCEYNDGNTQDQEAYKDCGTYNITIVGSEKNFVGETTVTETISGELIAKATITLDRSSYPYDKETGETFPSKVTVKYGKNTLTEGIDYTVSYKDYDKIGTAAVIITGMGNYSGVKTKTYKITGTKLTTRMVTQINKSFSYDGTEHSVENGTDYKIADGTAGLVEGKDYTVAYKGDRTKAGSFKVTFSGIGAYSGTVTKTFTIRKASVSTLTVTLPDESVAYTKGGVKPKPEVRFGGVLLTEGTDYTVTYQNNTKAASAEDKKAPCLYITGKGSFTGNTKASPVKFTIMQAPLSAQTIVVDNVPYKNRNGNYVPAITITDSTTGKKLAKNTDYSGSFTYEIWDAAAGDYVSFTGKKVETSEDNIRMRVTISAKGSYSGEASVEYEICPKSIASVKVEKIPNQEYTGQAITPKLTITDNGADLTEGIHYTVEYTNNIKKGTATVTIRGKGQYGGIKTVKFKITSRIFKWS